MPCGYREHVQLERKASNIVHGIFFAALAMLFPQCDSQDYSAVLCLIATPCDAPFRHCGVSISMAVRTTDA